MQFVIYGLWFVLGVVATLASLLTYGWYLGLKDRIKAAEQAQADMEAAIKKYEEEQLAATEALQQTIAEMVKRRAGLTTQAATSPQVPTDPNVSLSVKERLRKAVELTALQAKIDTRKGPDFIMQHNELELEKLSVLKTILADGFDPVITIRYNTGEQEMHLSAYIQSLTKGLA